MAVVHDAVIFTFDVTQRFLCYSHRFTIPKISHAQMRKLCVDKRGYRIIYPKGEVCAATMRLGATCGHEYYQLTVPMRHQKRPDYLKVGDHLIVVLTRPYGENLAILEYR